MRIKFRKLTALLAILMVLTSAFGSIFCVGGASSVALGDAIGASVYYNDGTSLQTAKLNSTELYPGGMPFGVKFFTNGVLIVGFCDIDNGSGAKNPAQAAGLRIKDVITEVNGEELTCAAQLTTTIENCGGKAVSLTYTREGVEHTVDVTPIYSNSDGRYKTGIWVRDSGAGIGTVTFIDPTDYSFAGLGHGICDNDTGDVIPMQRGIVTEVTISGLTKGVPGDPGEIKGYFNSGKCGTLLKNTDLGVYGIFAQLPAECPEGPLLSSQSFAE